MEELLNIVQNPFVSLAIVSETDRRNKGKIEVETFKGGLKLNQDEC